MAGTDNIDGSHGAKAADGKADQHRLRQEQICAHMNANHQDSLAFFLQVYNRVPRRESQSAKLEEVRLTGLTITTGHSTNKTHYFVPFEPALSSISEVREQVVGMHHHCLKALGRSDITIKEYRPPTGFPAVIFTTCLLTFIAFSRRANFEPGSQLYDLVLRHVPGFAVFCHTIQPLLIILMVAIHLAEAIYLSLYRLKPHNIPFGSRLWLCWFINNFIEGFTCLQRFDALVERERAKKAHK
ncbi:integral membrane protein [Talaromyces proteolyticus]|uniref:Integral membrane protein n=1 Tax=Talaromyces proteolyticus TaxID=1131652 RepID=A0AAD4KWF2_9EURO|nr:uncharacterized protein BGW36DRAFT_425297 [Talaromyces proteolyticus]KAH8700472.1 integral membrane protein [Talaromyces proteolyticus]